MRVKESLQKEIEKQDEDLDWSYQEWLDYFSNEPNNKELNGIKKESLKPTPTNNPQYIPKKGA